MERVAGMNVPTCFKYLKKKLLFTPKLLLSSARFGFCPNSNLPTVYVNQFLSMYKRI